MTVHFGADTGLMTCTQCGCVVVAEVKKGKYVYYHYRAWRRRLQSIFDPGHEAARLQPHAFAEALASQCLC